MFFKIASVCLRSFLGFGLLVFSETWYIVRGLFRVVHDRATFYRKKHIARKNCQKQSKSRVFVLFKKIMPFVLSKNGVI